MPAKQITALSIKQWLTDWNKVRFNKNAKEKRSKPSDHFYFFKISADDLRNLSDVHRRKADQQRVKDINIQRKHIPERSAEIKNFIKGGFPWSVLSEKKRKSTEFEDLRMPGWLPTAIIANILPPDAERNGKKIRKEDTITIKDNKEFVNLILPDNFNSKGWNPELKPIEIIDGQHRLLAFDDSDNYDGDFELPVVAFYDLDITWQAYLFYTINIKPKKINTSLAFDLYPLLRIQEWLEKAPSGAAIYKETRAQELTEILWSYPQSPWYKRINMLGETGSGPVTQASFIRSLTQSFVKNWESPRAKLGGLYGATIQVLDDDILSWSRVQQGAFLIFLWKVLLDEIKKSDEPWIKSLRVDFVNRNPKYINPLKLDAAFINEFSLLATDQGVRVVLQIINDLCYVGARDLKLYEWDFDYKEDDVNLEAIDEAVKSLYKLPINKFLTHVFSQLLKFDWRTSSATGLSEQGRINQMAFRGSGGYKELRRQVLKQLVNSANKEVKLYSTQVLELLGY